MKICRVCASGKKHFLSLLSGGAEASVTPGRWETVRVKCILDNDFRFTQAAFIVNVLTGGRLGASWVPLGSFHHLLKRLMMIPTQILYKYYQKLLAGADEFTTRRFRSLILCGTKYTVYMPSHTTRSQSCRTHCNCLFKMGWAL